MREKCARVLAAALMTAAIGFTLAMPALFGTARDAVRSLTAPPSSLQRSVHLVASSAPSAPVRAGGLEGLRPIAHALPRVPVPAFDRHSSSTGRPRSIPKPSRPLPTPQPAPKPAPATDTRALANETPAAPVASQPAVSSGNGKGKGKGRAKSNEKRKPPKPESQPAPPTLPAPATESQSDGEKDHGHDHGNGKGGNDKGREG